MQTWTERHVVGRWRAYLSTGCLRAIPFVIGPPLALYAGWRGLQRGGKGAGKRQAGWRDDLARAVGTPPHLRT